MWQLMLKSFYHFNRIFWYPFLRFIIPLFSKKARSRVKFENNKIGPIYDSFKVNSLVADYAFECSSEGEYEQIMPLLEYFLTNSKKVELIYCSESVEHRCLNLARKYPENLRILPLPILTYFPYLNDPSMWLSAPVFFMCRYDFFPELIFYGAQKNVDFKLLWALGKDSSGLQGMYQDFVFRKFNFILAATNQDKGHIQSRYCLEDDQISAYDLRPIQIARRLKLRETTLNEKFKLIESWQSFINEFNKQNRIIFGSFWEIETQVFKNNLGAKLLNEKVLMAVFPHNLNNIEEIKTLILNYDLKVYEINASTSETEFQQMKEDYGLAPGIFIFNIKGILCEFYQDFGISFVGGGHGVSIHSVMEPYVAGCSVFCGPKVHRSTEYQFILGRDPDKIQIVEDLNQFFPSIQKTLNLEYKEQVDMESYIKDFQNILVKLETEFTQSARKSL